MTGPTTRTVTHTRTVARCDLCTEQAEGVSVFESTGSGKRRDCTYHHCDRCLAAIEVRPLEAVLADYGDDA